MKNILCFTLFTLFLVSCTQNSDKPVQDAALIETNTGVVSENIEADESAETSVASVDSIISSISESLKSDENFRTCLQSNIDMCITESAYSKGVEPTCDDFILEENKISCRESLITSQAMESLDITKCDEIAGDSSSCKFEVIVGKGDISECESLDEGYKVSCNNSITSSQAYNEKDIKLCDKIISLDDNENYEKQFCVDEVTFMIEEQKRLDEEAKVQDAIIQEELQTQEDVASELQ